MPDPTTVDTARPDGAEIDVVDVLLTQHARLEEQFLLVVGATGTDRQSAFDDLVRLLTEHETVEEEVIHPLSRSIADGSDGMLDERLKEELQATQMLTALVDADVHSAGFEASLLVLRTAVLTHARHEERYEFPQLRAKVPAEQLRALASVVRADRSSPAV